MSTPTTPASFDSVCEALRDVHDEASLWHLSDELARIAPSGVQPVEAVVAEAKRRGIPTKSANTLRLYRDVAIRFTAADRVIGVSFSAHREALGGVGDPVKAKALLTDLAAQHGADGVSITTVKRAVAAATGKALPVASASKKQSGYLEVARDLAAHGGKAFIAELDALTSGPAPVKLDGLHDGLTRVLAEVEARRSKAARKAASRKAPAPTAVKPRSTATTAKPVGKATKRPAKAGAGDLRGL